MIRSKITMGSVWALLALALHLCPGIISPAHAQGSRKDDIVFNSRGIPLAGATIRVCAMPATGQPCTPLAQIFSDPLLTQALANPTTTDGLGNYSFYAAPGKYEIEISGPGITTKQIPNVILPNDPSSPNFSGAISGFSLSLSGNLTVTGNATVLGSLVSGTLNMTNQSSAPGTPASGSVNLYSKTADKRLYYKDDTGTEIGPIAATSGAQTNVINTFTAQQNFAADTQFGGPNPWFDIRKYGGYSSTTSTPPSTTGSITSGQTTLTLANAQDFANGQGIVVWLAGPAPSNIFTPGQPTVTPINLNGGSTTYNYKVIAENRTGGLTAASNAGTTTTGQATLGANNISLTACSRTNGIATYTSSSNHNLPVGAQVAISGFPNNGGSTKCDGVKTIATVPTGTTFTTNDGDGGSESATQAANAQVFACNQLDFPSGSYSGAKTIRYWIYRSVGAGSYSLVGVAQGIDPWYQDCGFPAPTAPGYVPATPPSSAQNGYLATTISSGGGTTTLTLANAASATVSSQTVLHDNSQPLLACLQAAINSLGGTCYVPNLSSNYWVYNAVTDTNTLSGVNNLGFRLHLNTSGTYLKQPWLTTTGLDLEGEPRSLGSFQYVSNSLIDGNAYPLIAAPNDTFNSTHYRQISLHCGFSQQSCFLSDAHQSGSGNAGLVFDDIHFRGENSNGLPIILIGGYDYYFERGILETGANIFSPYGAYNGRFASPAVIGSSSPVAPNRTWMDKMYFSAGGIQVDCSPNPTQPIANHIYEFRHALYENVVMPFYRINCASGSLAGVTFDDIELSDAIGGPGTPFLDQQNSPSLAGTIFREVYTFGQSLANGNSSLLNIATGGPGAGTTTTITPGMISVGGVGSSIQSYGGGIIGSTLTVPPAPASAVVSAGGGAGIGTFWWCYEGQDFLGNYTAAGPCISATTTSANQTITITPPPANTFPAGTLAMNLLRCNQGGASGCFSGGALYLGSPVPVTTTIVVNNVPFNGPNPSGKALSAGFTSSNVFGSGLTEIASGFSISHSTPAITANRTLTNPDVSGYVPVTSYLNSAYDNATRANGAIGSSWTVTNNGINISGNNFVGTAAGNDVAYWSASPFSSSQYSQVTLTALNGTTDFPGVAVLLSGSGASTQGYNCLETTTTIYLMKISGTTNTTLTSAATTGAAGDILRLEIGPSGALTCYKNGVSTLTATDTTYTSGQPGLFLFGTVATAKNWSGGNLHPLAHLDVEQDWAKVQHWNAGATVGCSNPVSGALTSGRLYLCFPGSNASLYTDANDVVQGAALPTTPNGVPQTLTSTPSGGVAQAPVWGLPGAPVNAQTGTTYTIAATDRASYLSFSNAAAIAVTLPQAGSAGFGSNFVFVACDIGAGTATITPTTSTISFSTGSAYTAAASSMTLTTGQCAWVYSDNTNYFAIRR